MYISLDLETTGFNSDKDKIIEFGAIKFDLNSDKTETLQFLINPEIEIPAIVTHITNIHQQDVKNSPLFSDKQQEIQDFLADHIIIGHNIQFDTGFLKANGITINQDEYDTHQLATILLPESPSHSLEILSQILNITHQEKHRALDDAIAAKELFTTLIEVFENLDPKLIQKIQDLSQKSNWPLKDLFKELRAKKTNISINIPEEDSSTKDQQIDLKTILTNKKDALHEINPPYFSIARDLSLNAKPNTYISLPQQLFKKLSQQLPDNIAQFDLPENYLSLNRLQEFEKKEHFEDHEIIGLIKLLIWSQKTKTGLLHEIDLFQKERELLSEVSVCESINILEKEFFIQKAIKTDEKNAAICTHEYSIQSNQEFEKFILVDFEKFIRNLQFSSTHYSSIDTLTAPLQRLQSIFPDNQEIDQLINKAIILFGIIGILFENNNDDNKFTPRCQVSNLELATKEWQEINAAISNLILQSKDLIKILNDQSQIHLQNWKKELIKLEEIFKHPQIEDHIVLIERNYNDKIIAKKIPNSIQTNLRQILEKSKNYQIIGENLDLADNGEFTKKHFQLPPDIPLLKPQNQEFKPEIYITEDAPQHDNQIQNVLPKNLAAYLKTTKGRTAIIFNAKKQLEFFTIKLQQLLKEEDITIISKTTGSVSKVKAQMKKNPDNSVLLLTGNIWSQLNDTEIYNMIDNLIIQKIPFAPPSDPYLIADSQNFHNPFAELQIPKAASAIRKIINRIPLQSDKKIIILDSRLINKSYAAFITENLKTIGSIHNISLKTLPDL